MPVWLIQIVVSIALTLVSTLIQAATATKPKEAGLRTQQQVGGKVPLSFLVGTYATAGKLEYVNSWGNAGGVTNSFLTHVVSLSDLPIHGVTKIYVNSEGLELGDDDHATQGFPVPACNIDGRDHLWLEFKDGQQTTANSFLTGKFGSDPDQPWEADMVGRGIAYVTLTARWNREFWNGEPRYLMQTEGILLYDPREDTTAGGSGPQRRDDPETWTFSDNPVVIIYNILIGIRYAGEWVWGMQDDIDPSRLPYDTWSTAMDLCDQQIELNAGGSEKRFRAGREISVNETPIDVINDLLTGCTGRMSESAGIYTILIGATPAAVATFTDASVIVTEGTTLEPFPPIDDVINGATATFVAPQQAWTPKETRGYYSAPFRAADGGHLRTVGLTLNTIFSGSTAQRVLKATVNDNRRFGRHVLPLTPEFGAYRPLQVLRWNSDVNQYVTKDFLITSIAEAPNGNVVVGLQEVDPTDHNWVPGTDEQVITYTPVFVIRPAPQDATGFQVFADSIDDNDGTPRRPTFRVQYEGDQDDVQSIGFEVKLNEAADDDLVVSGTFSYGNPATNPDPKSTRINNVFPPNTILEARFKFLPFSGRTTLWSEWLPVTTPDVRFGALDVYEGSITADLPESVKNWQTWVGDGLRDLIGQLEEVARRAQQQDLANYRDVQVMKRSLVSAFGDARAEFSEQIVAATGPNSSIALQLTSLESQVGTDLATAMTGLQTQIGLLGLDVDGFNGLVSTINTDIDGVQSAISGPGGLNSQLSVIAQAFTSLSAASANGNVSTANFRMTAASGPAGYSRIGAQTRVGGAGSWRGAAWFLDTPNNPALPTRFVVDAQQFVILNSANAGVFQPFIFESGEAKMMAARINVITAGILRNASGSTVLDLNAGTLRIST